MGGDGEGVHVHYGTPLVSEEELNPRKRKAALDQGQARQVAPWNQEVTDSEGRRRFHGAFSGGFSAGYFNTVGSKEGASKMDSTNIHVFSTVTSRQEGTSCVRFHGCRREGGLTGGSDDTYVQHLTRRATASQGCAVAVFNCRGCADHTIDAIDANDARFPAALDPDGFYVIVSNPNNLRVFKNTKIPQGTGR